MGTPAMTKLTPKPGISREQAEADECKNHRRESGMNAKQKKMTSNWQKKKEKTKEERRRYQQ